ncbi:hypothetical protein FKM82_030093, partial [Ascaphus truei]
MSPLYSLPAPHRPLTMCLIASADTLDINQSVDFLFDCGLVGAEDVSDHGAPQVLRKGPKRLLMSERESCSQDSLSSQRSCTSLSFAYGVNAWKSWVQRKYEGDEPSKGDELRFGPKPMRIKEDILACTAAELNYGLAQFVKEITRPNGERYEPDSIYYLCLGIQQVRLCAPCALPARLSPLPPCV